MKARRNRSSRPPRTGAPASLQRENLNDLRWVLHRRWVDLKSAITGKDDAALLNEAERGEDLAKKSYNKALENKDLTPEIRALVQK